MKIDKVLYRSAFLFFFLFLYICSCGKNDPVSSNNGNHIVPMDVLQTVEFLSSHELNGRRPGSSGYNLAADFVAEKFEEFGLTEAGDNGYKQKFNVEYNNIYGEGQFNIVENESVTKYFSLGDDFLFNTWTGSSDITAQLAFVGYGMSEPENGFDEYADIDVNGKVVLAFRQSPPWSPSQGSWVNRNQLAKAKVAADHGALGIIYVNKPTDPFWIFGLLYKGDGEINENLPILFIENTAAQELLSGYSSTIYDLQLLIDQNRDPASVLLDKTVQIKVNSDYNASAETSNIVGILEGDDADLKDEYILIGAHLDHLGSQGDSIFFPGANDNASGTAVLLKLAEKLALEEARPKRSIIFTVFSSEELGIIGAEYFKSNLQINLDDIKMMINLDCVGFGEEIYIYGKDSFPTLHEEVITLDNLENNIMNTYSEPIPSGTDAYPFFVSGIPVLYFEAVNTFEYTHTVKDTPDTLNKEMMEKLADLLFEFVRLKAN